MTDLDLLASMLVNDRMPKVAIVVRVTKAFRQAHLWDSAYVQDRTSMPSLMKMLLDQTRSSPDDDVEMRKMDAGLEKNYKRSMY